LWTAACTARHLQAKEGTIESQVLALRKQIAAAGHEIVREYIDDGYPGARLDRPALDEMQRAKPRH
jgi:DNA invertase Pin-like site-specific DNA recombinase